MESLNQSYQINPEFELYISDFKEYIKQRKGKKVNWKLAFAGASAVLSSIILGISVYINFPYNSDTPEIQQIEEQTETHQQHFLKSELPDKLEEDKLK